MKRLRVSLEEIIRTEQVSAHMPGHKYTPLHNTNWFALDTTEIEGTDNLHAPEGILKEAMQYCAQVYGTKWSHYLVNGSTVGMISAILGCCKPGEQILIGRDCHKSVYSALALNHLKETVIMPKISYNGEMLGYDDEQVVELLNCHPEIKVVVLTSPTYFGHCTPLAKIVKTLEARGGTLIADEAHGAHLNFSDEKHWCALQQGAHIVVQSAHKMLPALTQSGMIHFHISISEYKMKSVLKYLSMLQSTSPSYVLMASIDDAVNWMEINGLQRQRQLSQQVKQIREHQLKEWIHGDVLPQDIFKLWLTVEPLGYDGYQVSDWLIQHGIMPELANRHGVLLYLSVATTLEDLTKICDTLGMLTPKHPIDLLDYSTTMPYPERVLTLSEMADLAIEKALVTLPLEQCLGLVCADKVVPYPPGVPLLMPGERITAAHILYLQGLSQKHVVLGYSRDKNVLQCIDSAYFSKMME